jgi:chromosome segregation ATPase
MSDEQTQNLTDGRSFEERIFARFDALDARMDRMEARMDRIESRLDNLEARFDKVEARLDDMDARLQTLEAKAYDTKPIWERALAEILALGDKVDRIEGKLGPLASDLLELRSNQTRLRERMDRLESNRAQ